MNSRLLFGVLLTTAALASCLGRKEPSTDGGQGPDGARGGDVMSRVDLNVDTAIEVCGTLDAASGDLGGATGTGDVSSAGGYNSAGAVGGGGVTGFGGTATAGGTAATSGIEGKGGNTGLVGGAATGGTVVGGGANGSVNTTTAGGTAGSGGTTVASIGVTTGGAGTTGGVAGTSGGSSSGGVVGGAGGITAGTGGATVGAGGSTAGGTTGSGGATATGGLTGSGGISGSGGLSTGGATGSGGTGTGTGKAAGTGCAGAGECQTGLTCLDGVCCTQASCPQCQNCGATGTCSITVTVGEDATGIACTGTNTCNAAGLCRKKPGESCTPTQNECASGTCTDNRCCSQSCEVCQSCTGLGGTCVAITNADDPDSCTGTNTCNATGLCRKKPGESCTPPGEDCATRTCTDGRCCSQSCGVCQSCTGPSGTCLTVSGVEDPDTCSGSSTCNAAGLCKKKDGQSCLSNSDCLTGVCNNSNVCSPLTSARCAALAATCGPTGTGDCCASLLVPGGTFYRSYDGVALTDTSYPATLSDFYLDKYEVTVGRFRMFVNAGKGTQLDPPAPGDGVHPKIPGSGWNSAWNTSLPADTEALKSNLKCNTLYGTWTDAVGANENKPIDCLNWYTAFAFCAWDGGRMATEAEWNYAASGGSEQRYYPWASPSTSTVIDDSFAVYGYNGEGVPVAVGTKSTKGDGKWGQADLAGNVWEFTRDWYAPYTNPCINCGNLSETSNRVIRGGSFQYGAPNLRSAYRAIAPRGTYEYDVGVRCARSGF
jgi:sulfatase modifying factor 1